MMGGGARVERSNSHNTHVDGPSQVLIDLLRKYIAPYFPTLPLSPTPDHMDRVRVCLPMRAACMCVKPAHPCRYALEFPLHM